MKELADLLLDSPVRFLVVIVVLAMFALIVLLARIVAKHFTSEFSSFKTKMDVWERSIEMHMRETKRALTSHSTDLGKATKAVNGDMLKIEKAVFEMRTDTLGKIAEAGATAVKLEAETKALARVFTSTVDNFDQRLAHIVNLRKELAALHGQITRVQTESGEFRVLHGKVVEKFEGQVGTIAKALKKHQDEIEQIKKDKPQ